MSLFACGDKVDIVVFLGSREKIFSLPFSVCGGSEKSLWRFEVIVGLGYTC